VSLTKHCEKFPSLTCHVGHREHGENARLLGGVWRTGQHLLRVADLLPQAPIREEWPLGQEEDPVADSAVDPDMPVQRLPQSPGKKI